MSRSVNMVVIGDMNNAQGRELVLALQTNPSLQVPYNLVHIDEIRDLLPGIRATPAVGVMMWASDLQEAVAIGDVCALSQYITSQSDYEDIAQYAMELEYASAMMEIGVTENDLQTV